MLSRAIRGGAARMKCTSVRVASPFVRPTPACDLRRFSGAGKPTESATGEGEVPPKEPTMEELQKELLKKQIEESSANKARLDKEALKAGNEADETAQRTAAQKADRDEKKTYEKWRRRFKWLVIGALAVDCFLHESDWWIQHLMRNKLLSMQLSDDAAVKLQGLPKDAPMRFTYHRMPPRINFPIVLLGPTGCGKSVLLAQMMENSLAQKTPAVVVNFRLAPSKEESVLEPASSKSADDPKSADAKPAPDQKSSAKQAIVRLDTVAAGIFEALGFPLRPWLPLHWVDLLNLKLSGGTSWLQWTRSLSSTPRRIQSAINNLFTVCKTIQKENGVMCLVMLDEIQDLLREDRLATVGGDIIATTIADNLLKHCINNPRVRVVMTGSSSFLVKTLEKTARLDAERYRVRELQFADEASVLAALGKGGVGYTDEEAKMIWNTVGGKLRLLSPFLMERQEDVSQQLDAVLRVARGVISSLFTQCNPDIVGISDNERSIRRKERKALIALLERVKKGEEAEFDDLPPRFQSEEAIGKVLYLNSDKKFVFQSQLIALAWDQCRAKYTKWLPFQRT